MIREVPQRMGCGPERPVSHTLGRVELARLRHCNVAAADEAHLPAGFVIRQLRLPAPHARHLDATPRSSEAFLRRRMARDDPAPNLETYVPIRRAFRQTAPGTCQAAEAPLQQSTQAPCSQHPLCQPSPSEQPPAALRQYFGQHHGLLILSCSSAWPSSSASSRRRCAGISALRAAVMKRPVRWSRAGSTLQTTKKPTHRCAGFLFHHSGRDGRIRTDDPLPPRQMRYQAALRPD